MNRDDIMRLAREHIVWAKYTEFGWQECFRYEFDVDELVHFAALVAAHEREACAKVCDVEASNRHIDRINMPWDATELRDVFRIQAQQASDCAAAIRARGEA